jgi:hypothetical protein
MMFRIVSVLAAVAGMFAAAQAGAVDAPEVPVLPVPQSPTSAASTLYPQVATPAVLSTRSTPGNEQSLPPIQVPSPPTRDNSTPGMGDGFEAVKGKSPGG